MAKNEPADSGIPDQPVMAGYFGGLSGRILLLTVVFVMLAEILIFVPSIANMRLTWLRDRLNTAAAASIVIDGLPGVKLPRSLQDDTLMATGTKAIALHKEDMTRMIVVSEMPPMVDATYNLADVSTLTAISDAFVQLLAGGDCVISITGPIGASDMSIEVVMDDRSLSAAMLLYARTILITSLAISLITAGLIFLAINRILIAPIRRMTRSMQAFSADPDQLGNIMLPEPGRDELSVAGQHLASMQSQLQKTLRQQKNLADLGLAVSKINHDMRNILSSAQLMSDRLADVEDPMVKGFAPKLLRTLDRAIGYTTEVLAYGKASEAEPKRRMIRLREIAEDVGDILGLGRQREGEFVIQIAPDLEIDADGEQLFRVIHNLCRNALQALESDDEEAGRRNRRICLSAHRSGSVVTVSIDDNGPGMPKTARENLFQPFRGSARSGGTGLGLAIAREIVLAHGGTIALVEKAARGTLFRFDIPDRAVSIETARNVSRH
jgi:signal transduction histidine kinase